MHGTVLVEGDGRPTRADAPLWNDKRTFVLEIAVGALIVLAVLVDKRRKS